MHPTPRDEEINAARNERRRSTRSLYTLLARHTPAAAPSPLGFACQRGIGGGGTGVVTVVQRFRSDLGLYVHLHCLVTDGAYEEQNDGALRFLAAPPPTPERMTAVLAQVHEVVRAADDGDLDLDPALAASLAGPRPAPDSPSAPPPMTLSAFGMNLHAATTADGRDRKQPRANLPLPPAPALRPRRRHGAPRRPRPGLLQGPLA